MLRAGNRWVRTRPGFFRSEASNSIRKTSRRAPKCRARSWTGSGSTRAADPARRQHAPRRRRDSGENLPAIAPGISGALSHHRAAPRGAHAGDRGPTARPRRAIGAAERSVALSSPPIVCSSIRPANCGTGIRSRRSSSWAKAWPRAADRIRWKRSSPIAR